MSKGLELATDLVARAMASGASAADALIVSATSMTASVRMGQLEDIERSEGHDLGLRVMIGQKQAMASSNDWSTGALQQLVERVVAMAKAAPEDPYCGLVDPDLLQHNPPDLDLYDASEPTSLMLREAALEVEAIALDVPGVTNSEGGSAYYGSSQMALATSAGFAGTYRASSHALSCSDLAGEGTGMERDGDYHSTRHKGDLRSAKEIGTRAGARAVERLNPRKVKTQSVPVIFERRVSGSLLGHFAGAISGTSVARGSSFLKDKMGQRLFAPGIQIVDDPHRLRGLASRPFDGEGAANRRQNLIDDGVLTTWIMDSSSARQLGLKSSGHAGRGTGGPPGPSTTNLHLAPGPKSLDDMIKEIGTGLLITELIGFGVNGVTGDYSRGCSGFWIAGGALAYPVSEVTIAGNLLDMFARLEPASDLEFKGGTNAPSLRIDGLTLAGT
jgi:PmbA protein